MSNAAIPHIERTVNVLDEEPTKITIITNASVSVFYNIENTDLEIGISGVLLRIL